jgi:DNA polymerase-1
MISDEAQLVDLVKIIEQKELVAVDVETTGLDMSVCEVVGVSLAVDSKVAYYVPFGHKKESGDLATEQISEEQVRRILFPLLENSTVKKIFHNGRFDLHFIKKWGAAVRGFDFDTIVAARMLLPEWLKVALKSLSSSLLGLEREVCAEVMRGLKNFSYIGLEKATTYAALDAQQTFQLYEIFCEKFIKEPGLKKLFYSLEMPLSEVLFEMENQGLLLDEKKLEQFGVQVEKQIVLHIAKLDAFLETLPELEGKKINYNSPKQVQHLLFDVLGLKSGRKTTTKQFSTDIKVLEELESVHFVPALIMKYRKLKKLLSTYIKALPDHVNLITGRIHTSLSQIAAATGRLASFNPNLQNIPTELASEFNIRSAFVSAVGKSFISIDYSQIELRVLAHLSKDPVLTEIFLEENDLHALTAGSIFSKDFSDVSKQERNVGKRINFSILYGLSSYSLSKDLKVERKVAQGYVDNFFATYAAVMPWMDALVEKAKEDGFITTLMGRKRFFRDLSDRNKMIAQAARRAAINSVVQGTAAEVLKQAMIELSTALKEKMHDAKMILQVHDELLLEVSDDALADVSSLAKQVLENSVQWNVPIKVCVKIGKNWGEMEPLVL